MNFHNWESFGGSNLQQEIIATWEKLLDNVALKEKSYHEFLYHNPAIFLTGNDSYLVISKLKIGVDYETDFVVVREGYSDGTRYDLIEIESPHTPLFNKRGQPSRKLNESLQQIRDWKRALQSDRIFFRKTFPSVSTKIIKDSRLKFKIVIGRTTTDLEELEKRRQISEENNVEIISFDRLTEMAKRKMIFLNEAYLYDSQKDEVTIEKMNELANPFYKCITDAQWRSFCNKGNIHFYSKMINSILDVRTYNEYYLRFINEKERQ